MARTARLKKSFASTVARPTARPARETAYHGDVAGHQRILEALGAVPEMDIQGPSAILAAEEREERWPPLKTLFFVVVFCSTAWATISAAVLVAFN